MDSLTQIPDCLGIPGYRHVSVTGNPLSGVIICPAQRGGGQRFKVNSLTCSSSGFFYALLLRDVNRADEPGDYAYASTDETTAETARSN